jgi:transposase IS66 family protein
MNQEFTSEAARNYVRRITKYQDRLFMFLRHDGVPWNNNNAEHAIKSFAKFRRTSNGVVTEDTISEYLVILSVCLTSEYRGPEGPSWEGKRRFRLRTQAAHPASPAAAAPRVDAEDWWKRKGN